jgi:hypothetical protein
LKSKASLPFLIPGLLLVLIIGGAGCANPRALMVGMYAVPEANLPTIRKLGMDFVVGSPGKSYLDTARRWDLKVITSGAGNGDHPAVLGHLLTDEPDLKEIPTAGIKNEFEQAKRKSRKPVFLNLSSGYSVEVYEPYCDVVMFDWYPAGWQPIETMWNHIRIARLASKGKPFYVIIQAFDWSRYPQMMPYRKELRAPTSQEIRAMAIWAAMGGASGVVFYPFDDGVTRMEDSTETMKAVEETAHFLHEWGDLFRSRRSFGAYPFEFENKEDQYNSVFEGSIAIRYAKNSKGEEYLVAANTLSRKIKTRMRNHFRPSDPREYFEFEPLEVKLIPGRLQTNESSKDKSNASKQDVERGKR